jgi:hypothetical protein
MQGRGPAAESITTKNYNFHRVRTIALTRTSTGQMNGLLAQDAHWSNRNRAFVEIDTFGKVRISE